MSVSKDFLAYILEQLALLPRVTTRRMFGAIGIYSSDLFFAIVDDDVVYFKVDDSNRHDYVARGSMPFCPFPDKPLSMNYYDIPADVLEDAEQLSLWARRSLAVAARSAKAKKPKPKLRASAPKKKSKAQTTHRRATPKVKSPRR
jgi:DNA transformation protein